MRIKTIFSKVVKRVGLYNEFLVLNFTVKRLLGIKQKEFHSLKEFYKTHIKNNSLVFDVGSNIGDRADVFLSLGARCICLEPNGNLIKIVKARFQGVVGLKILNKGCGSKVGTLQFKLASNSLVSTFSEKFIEHRHKIGENSNWDHSVEVEVTTLDNLISEFGVPDFCKIDVEGYEKNVLEGLNSKVGTISFEFTSPTFNEDTIWCVNKLTALGYASFNISFGESLQFVFDEWITGDALAQFISVDSKMKRPAYGDIYAR